MNKKRKGKTIEFKNLAFYDKKTAIFLLNNKGFSGFKTNSIFYHKSSKKHLNLVFFVGFPPFFYNTNVFSKIRSFEDCYKLSKKFILNTKFNNKCFYKNFKISICSKN